MLSARKLPSHTCPPLSRGLSHTCPNSGGPLQTPLLELVWSLLVLILPSALLSQLLTIIYLSIMPGGSGGGSRLEPGNLKCIFPWSCCAPTGPLELVSGRPFIRQIVVGWWWYNDDKEMKEDHLEECCIGIVDLAETPVFLWDEQEYWLLMETSFRKINAMMT